LFSAFCADEHDDVGIAPRSAPLSNWPAFLSSGISSCWLAPASGLFALPFAQPYTRSAAVFVDEFDAGSAQNGLDCDKRPFVPSVSARLDIRDGVPMEIGGLCKFSNCPI
jgi:hypothetical protein